MATVDIDYRERVLSRLWNEPDGLTLRQLLETFPPRRRSHVVASLRSLIRRGLVVKAFRVHADDPAKDHPRLILLRSKTGRSS